MEKDFQNLLLTFKSSIKTWDYFINWQKVFRNSSEIEIILNTLNYLLGKEKLKDEFTRLYSLHPEIIQVFPVLLAVRDNNIEIFNKTDQSSDFFDFSDNSEPADKYFRFLKESGLLQLFQKDGVKNLVDYCIGVEVGLDSNGRKNRGGTLMENIVEDYVKNLCERKKFEYISQATSNEIKNKWNFNVKVDKTSRRYDFAIYNPTTNKLRLIETNFFNGGGSKLKSTAGEFKSLNDNLLSQNIELLWITDGPGWKSAERPLEETYNHNDKRIYNLSMLSNNILDDLSW